MIADAEARMFDIIVCHKLDLVYLNRLKELKVSFASVSEAFDFTTPLGKMLLTLLALLAEWFLDNLRTEIVKGKRERVRQGYWNGLLSWGYTTTKRVKEKLLH
jgi:site-specific DNA recombinase